MPSAQVAQGGRGSMIALIGKKKSHAEKANAVTTQIPGGAIMPHYLIRGRMSRASISAIVKNPQNRTEAAGAIISAAGGRLHHYFFALGEDDIVLIVEFPDNLSAAALSMIVGSTGAVEDMKSTALLTMDEAVTAMHRAHEVSGAYRPPQA